MIFILKVWSLKTSRLISKLKIKLCLLNLTPISTQVLCKQDMVSSLRAVRFFRKLTAHHHFGGWKHRCFRRYAQDVNQGHSTCMTYRLKSSCNIFMQHVRSFQICCILPQSGSTPEIRIDETTQNFNLRGLIWKKHIKIQIFTQVSGFWASFNPLELLLPPWALVRYPDCLRIVSPS